MRKLVFPNNHSRPGTSWRCAGSRSRAPWARSWPQRSSGRCSPTSGVWSLPAGLTLGLALSVASTVVLLRARAAAQARVGRGRIAVGWLIVEDLVMVLALVLLPALAETFGGTSAGVVGAAAAGRSAWILLALTLAKVALFVAFALIVGSRVVPWALERSRAPARASCSRCRCSRSPSASRTAPRSCSGSRSHWERSSRA